MEVLRRQPGGPTAALSALQALVGDLQPEDLATALAYCRWVGVRVPSQCSYCCVGLLLRVVAVCVWCWVGQCWHMSEPGTVCVQGGAVEQG